MAAPVVRRRPVRSPHPRRPNAREVNIQARRKSTRDGRATYWTKMVDGKIRTPSIRVGMANSIRKTGTRTGAFNRTGTMRWRPASRNYVVDRRRPGGRERRVQMRRPTRWRGSKGDTK